MEIIGINVNMVLNYFMEQNICIPESHVATRPESYLFLAKTAKLGK